MSKAKLDVEEYNRAIDSIANTVAQLGVESAEEDGFPVICKLNIGGQEFQCHRDHLRSQPGSLLSKYRRNNPYYPGIYFLWITGSTCVCVVTWNPKRETIEKSILKRILFLYVYIGILQLLYRLSITIRCKEIFLGRYTLLSQSMLWLT